MEHHIIAIILLIAMFVTATALPINIGVLAFVGAFGVGVLLAGQTTKEILSGFPNGLFLTLVGITWLFALAQNNGTIDWLVRGAVRGVRGRIVMIPWIMLVNTACRALKSSTIGSGPPVEMPATKTGQLPLV